MLPSPVSRIISSLADGSLAANFYQTPNFLELQEKEKGYKFESAQIEMVPQNYQKLDKPEDIANMEKMLDIFEDDDDVQNVWHNWEQE